METEQTDHPSNSAIQREIELAMLHRLSAQHPDWQRVNWDMASVELGLPAVWRRANPDAVWNAESGEIIVAEAYARLGELKSGHRRKMAMDALKLRDLREDIPDRKRLRCLLVVPEELMRGLEGTGWFPRTLRRSAEITPIDLLHGERERLREASRLQGLGQARTRAAAKAEEE